MHPASPALRVFTGLATACLLLATPAVAQRAPVEPQEYGSFGKPDEAAGREALARFRESTLQGGFYLEFELRFLPRRGVESSQAGRLWSGHTSAGQSSLVELAAKDGAPAERFLIINGPTPEVWRWEAESKLARMLAGAEVFRTLGTTQFTPFLLQMPFIFWKDATYDGLVRLRSRPTHAYKLAPPMGFPSEAAGFAAVRLLVDSQFNALNEVEFLAADGKRASVFSVGELAKVDERWMLRWIDYRDERTRDKSRLHIRRAAVGLSFPEDTLSPLALGGSLPAVSEDRIRTLDPR